MTDDNQNMDNQAPPWGAVFEETYIDPDNLAIASEGARKLTPKQMKRAKHVWKECNQVLTGAGNRRNLPDYSGYEARIEKYKRVVERYNDIKQHLGTDDVNVKRRLARLRKLAMRLAEYIEQARWWIARQRYVEARINEHFEAVRFQRQLERDRAQMRKEVKYFAKRLVERWSALGYKEEIYETVRTGNDLPRIRRTGRYKKVGFEKCIATEDELIFKIAVSRQTLFDSTRSELPEKVKAYDLVKPETIHELEAAVERPVYSPHNKPEEYGSSMPFHNGAWVVVCRVDHRGGLRDYFPLKTQLAHYPNDERHRFPIALGLKRGRKLNWGYIDNKTPHYMFNGLTGSGKTNAIVGCLVTLMKHHPPSELRFLLTDLKRGGNFRQFKEAPHNLLQDVIHDIGDLAAHLEEVLQVMYARQQKIGAVADDINGYNKVVPPDDRLARLIIVIDEYSETRQMIDDKNVLKKKIDTVVDAVARLGRAAGIHLFIGNQQPTASNMTVEMRGNITYALTGYQRTMGASMMTTGDKSARELKNHPGRMLADNGQERFEVQLPHCTEDDIASAVKVAQDWPTPPEFDWHVRDDAISTEDIIQAIIPRQMTIHDLVEVALTNFDGALSARKIFDEYVKEDKMLIASYNDVCGLRDDLVKRGAWEYKESLYSVEKVGRGYKLILGDMHELHDLQGT